jgi:hypothetical protein
VLLATAAGAMNTHFNAWYDPVNLLFGCCICARPVNHLCPLFLSLDLSSVFVKNEEVSACVSIVQSIESLDNDGIVSLL